MPSPCPPGKRRIGYVLHADSRDDAVHRCRAITQYGPVVGVQKAKGQRLHAVQWDVDEDHPDAKVNAPIEWEDA